MLDEKELLCFAPATESHTQCVKSITSRSSGTKTADTIMTTYADYAMTDQAQGRRTLYKLARDQETTYRLPGTIKAPLQKNNNFNHVSDRA